MKFDLKLNFKGALSMFEIAEQIGYSNVDERYEGILIVLYKQLDENSKQELEFLCPKTTKEIKKY